MADIDDALYARLSGYAGLSALVGTRISVLRMKEDQILPSVTYQEIGGQPIKAMGGDTGIVKSVYQVDCWGGRIGDGGYSDVKAVAVQVKGALQRYGGTQVGVVIQQIFLEDQHPSYESDTDTVRVRLEFTVWHEV